MKTKLCIRIVHANDIDKIIVIQKKLNERKISLRKYNKLQTKGLMSQNKLTMYKNKQR